MGAGGTCPYRRLSVTSVAISRSASQYVLRFTWEAYHQEIVGHYRTLAEK
jgi:hypothetical protein